MFAVIGDVVAGKSTSLRYTFSRPPKKQYNVLCQVPPILTKRDCGQNPRLFLKEEKGFGKVHKGREAEGNLILFFACSWHKILLILQVFSSTIYTNSYTPSKSSSFKYRYRQLMSFRIIILVTILIQIFRSDIYFSIFPRDSPKLDLEFPEDIIVL